MSNPAADRSTPAAEKRGPKKRRLLVLLATAAAAVAALYCIIVHLVIPGMIRDAIEKEGLLKGGLLVRCSRVGFSLLPTSVTVDNVVVFDPRMSVAEGTLLKADRVHARFSLAELVSRRIKPTISIRRPRLRLACDKDGTWNVSAFKSAKRARAGSEKAKRRAKKTRRLQIVKAEISFTDGSLEIVDGKLDGARIRFADAAGDLIYADNAFNAEKLVANVARGRMELSGTRLRLGDENPSARIRVRGVSIRPDEELKPFLARMFPRTSLKGVIDFNSDVALDLEKTTGGRLKIKSIKGRGDWNAELGVLRGPETPDYITALIPGLSLSNFKFYRMRGEFMAFGQETLAEMDVADEKVSLHVRGYNKVNGAMKYVLFLDLNRGREQGPKALSGAMRSGVGAPRPSSSKPFVEEDYDFGRLQLLTFQAIMGDGARLKDEKTVFATEEMILRFIKVNYGSFTNYLSELKSLRRRD